MIEIADTNEGLQSFRQFQFFLGKSGPCIGRFTVNIITLALQDVGLILYTYGQLVPVCQCEDTLQRGNMAACVLASDFLAGFVGAAFLVVIVLRPIGIRIIIGTDKGFLADLVFGTGPHGKCLMVYVIGINVIGTVGMMIVKTHITIDRQTVIRIKSQMLTDHIGMKACRCYFIGLHQSCLTCFLIGLLFVGTQLIAVQFLPAIAGITAYHPFLDIQIGLFIQPALLRKADVVACLYLILSFIGNDIHHTTDGICTIKCGSGTILNFDTFHRT